MIAFVGRPVALVAIVVGPLGEEHGDLAALVAGADDDDGGDVVDVRHRPAPLAVGSPNADRSPGEELDHSLAGPLPDVAVHPGHATSYLLNERVEADSFVDENGELVPGEAVFDRHVRIANPTHAIIAFLGNTNKTATGTDHIHSGLMRSWNGLRREIWPDAFGGGSADGSTGSANYLFADGHVQNIAAATLKERVESGQDITVEF